MRGARQADAARRSGRDRRRGKPVSSATSAIARRLVVASRSAAVFSAMHATFAFRAGQRDPLVQLDELRSGGIGCPGQPSISVAPAAWQRTNACGAEPWTSPSVTPEYIGCTSEPWPSTKRSSPRVARPRRRAARRRPRGSRRRRRRPRSPTPRSRSPSARSARTPRRARAARLEVELDRDGLLADRAVRADGEDDLGVDLEVRAGRDVQPLGRLAEVAQLDAVLARELGQLGVLGDELVQAALDVEPGCDATSSAARARPAGSGRPASRRRRPRPSARTASASSTVPTIGMPSWCSRRPLRVEDRDDRIGAVADDPAHRLAVVRVVREALAEDEDAPVGHRPESRGPPQRARSEHGRRRRARARAPDLDAVDELHAGPRVLAQEEVPVEVDVVAERRDAAAGRDPEARLEHAAEHHAQPSARAAWAMRIASRIPPDFASLMLMPCAISAHRRDVGERVAVLVDVDRDRRARPSARARRRRPPSAAARSTRRRSRRAAGARRAPRRATTTRSRRPSAGGR